MVLPKNIKITDGFIPDILCVRHPLTALVLMDPNGLNLSVTMFSAKAVYSQWLTPGVVSRLKRPHPGSPGEAALVLGRLLISWKVFVLEASGRNTAGLFHDREAHAGLVPVLFRNRAPGILGLLAGRERTLHLGRTMHEGVEIHRTELAANHPVIAAFGHGSLLLLTGCYSAA